MSLGRTRFRQTLLKNQEAPGRYGYTRGAFESGQETRFLALGASYGYSGQTIQNQAPIWLNVQTVTFIATATAQFFPTSGTYQSNFYVIDPEVDPLSISKNTVPVQGVTWDGGKFIFDGTGAVQVTTGHILTASDGQGNSTPSSAFIIAIQSEQENTWIGSTTLTIQSGDSFPLSALYVAGAGKTSRFEIADGRDFVLPDGISMDGDGNLSVDGGTSATSFALKVRGSNEALSNDDVREIHQFDDRNFRSIPNALYNGGHLQQDAYSHHWMSWERPNSVTEGVGGEGGFVGPNGDAITQYHSFNVPGSAGEFSVNITALASRWLENGRSHGLCLIGSAGVNIRIRSREHSPGPAPKVTYQYGGSSEQVFADNDTHANTQGTNAPQGNLTTFRVNGTTNSDGPAKAFIHFRKPTGTLVSATLTMYLDSITSGAGQQVTIWLAKPPFEDCPETIGYLKDEGGLYYYRRNLADEFHLSNFDNSFNPDGGNLTELQYSDTDLGHAVTRAALTQFNSGQQAGTAFSFSIPIWNPTTFAEALDLEFEYWWHPESTFDSPSPTVGLQESGKHFGFSSTTKPDENVSAQWDYLNGSGVGGLFTSPIVAANPSGKSPKGRIGGLNTAGSATVPVHMTSLYRGNGGASANGREGWSIRGGYVPGFLRDSVSGPIPPGFGTHAMRNYHILGSYVYLASYKHPSQSTILVHHEAVERQSQTRRRSQPNDVNAQNSATGVDFTIVGITSTNPAVLSFSYDAGAGSTHARSEDELIRLDYNGNAQSAEWIALEGSPSIRISNVAQSVVGSVTTGTCELVDIDASAFPPFVAVITGDESVRTVFAAQIEERSGEMWASEHPNSPGDYLLPGEDYAFNDLSSGTGNDLPWSQYGRGAPRRGQWHVIRQRLIVNTVNPNTPDQIDFRGALQDPTLLGNWDGRLMVWVDTKLTLDVPGLCLRYKGPYYTHAADGLDTELACGRIWCNLFHGGVNFPLSPAYFRIANFSVRVNTWGRTINNPLL